MCEECMNHALATVYGEEQARWYFSPHAYDHESFLAALDKSTEYQSQYEILNAINPGKYGVEWVRKVVEGGRTAQVCLAIVRQIRGSASGPGQDILLNRIYGN